LEDFTQDQLNALLSFVPEDQFSTGPSERALHSRDISPHRGTLPAGVIWPLSTDDVSKILSWTYEQDIPVTPWGAGTSTEGNPVPIRGGLILDMTRMNRVLDIRPVDLQVDVQPGVLRRELNHQAGRQGLFFPVDPGADATIGGMIANNASGIRTIKYGATRDYVLKLTVVLPDGKVIHTGCKARKSSSGYDLTRLFVGSEGTLGVVMEATLRLVGLPVHHLAVTVTFETLDAASEAVAMMIGAGLEPAALELLTVPLIRLMNRERGLGLLEAPSLFCEFHGVSNPSLLETAELAREICDDCGTTGFEHGLKENERKALWRARHDAWETIHHAHTGMDTLIVDAAVPISRYPEMVVYSQNLVDEAKVPGYVFGHAGDGNLHVVLIGDPRDSEKWGKLESINHSIVEKAISVEGTCTGEHGIGIGKRKFMNMEHGESLQLMRDIKQLLDPKGLMNPGKIFF